MDKREGYCMWYEKNLRDISEHEKEKCYTEAGLECLSCLEIEYRGKEKELKE